MNIELTKQYQEALNTFVQRLRKDKNVIAVYLYGSLHNGDIWEKSDIDIFIVINEEKVPFQALSLVENDIRFHAEVYSRSLYKKNLETISQGSSLYNIFTSGTLIFSDDEKITEYYANRECLGTSDLECQLLSRSFGVLGMLEKAEKWLRFKKSTADTAALLIKLAETLADMEVLLNGGMPQRESIHQALLYNPELFRSLYTDLIVKPVDYEVVQKTYQLAEDYFKEKTAVIFRPILDYLQEMDRVISDSELYHYFEKKLNLRLGYDSMSVLCDWLAEQQMLQKFTSPVRLSSKSRVTMDEAAYLYGMD